MSVGDDKDDCASHQCSHLDTEAGMGAPRHECVSADCEEEQSIGAFAIENES